MTRISQYAIGATAAAACALLAPIANAAPLYYGDTYGSYFTSGAITNVCPAAPVPSSDLPCGLWNPGHASQPAAGDFNTLLWHGGELAVPFQSFQDTSPTSVTGVTVAQLQMHVGASPTGSTSFTYQLNISIIDPAASSENVAYSLDISTLANGGATGGTNSIMSFLVSAPALAPISVEASNGDVFTLSNFQWVPSDNSANGVCDKTSPNFDARACTGNASIDTYVDGDWTVGGSYSGSNGEFGTLDLVADIIVSVPEPASLTVFGASLLLLAGGARLRRRKTG